MIAVVGAMESEIDGVRRRMRVESEHRWGLIVVREGRLGERRLCCARSGVGKACAAAVTTHVIDRYRPESVVYVGIAGALDPALEIGDLVVATECLQHDLDATVFGFARGEVPYDRIRWIASDPRLFKVARGYRPSTGRCVTGRVLTGDRFFSAADRRERDYLTGELGGVAVEMEGAGAAIAASFGAVPFLLARVISDKADGTAPRDFATFLPVAAERIAEFVSYLAARV